MTSTVSRRFPTYIFVVTADTSSDSVLAKLASAIRPGYPKLFGRKPHERSHLYGRIEGERFAATPVTSAFGGRTGPRITGEVRQAMNGTEVVVDVRLNPLSWLSVLLLPSFVLLLAQFFGHLSTAVVVAALAAAVLGFLFDVVVQIVEGKRVQRIVESILGR